MIRVFIALLCLSNLSLIMAQCATGHMGKSMLNLGWSNYQSLIKNQGATSMCWSFATTSYIETMYNILTNNRYKLSVQQLSDNIYNYFQIHPSEECKDLSPRPAFNGGDLVCALKYVEHNGIMTEYDYPFVVGGEKYSYNASMITPIGVKNIKKICTDRRTTSDKFTCLCDNLRKGVVLAAINGNNLLENGVVMTIDELSPINHAILVTDICIKDDKAFIEFQNSWGKWGVCGTGMGYIYIGSDIEGVLNNLRVFDELVMADVYNRYTTGQALTIEKKDYVYLSGQDKVVYGLSVFLTIAMIVILILLVAISSFMVVIVVRYRRRHQELPQPIEHEFS